MPIRQEWFQKIARFFVALLFLGVAHSAHCESRKGGHCICVSVPHKDAQGKPLPGEPPPIFVPLALATASVREQIKTGDLVATIYCHDTAGNQIGQPLNSRAPEYRRVEALGILLFTNAEEYLEKAIAEGKVAPRQMRKAAISLLIDCIIKARHQKQPQIALIIRPHSGILQRFVNGSSGPPYDCKCNMAISSVAKFVHAENFGGLKESWLVLNCKQSDSNSTLTVMNIA